MDAAASRSGGPTRAVCQSAPETEGFKRMRSFIIKPRSFSRQKSRLKGDWKHEIKHDASASWRSEMINVCSVLRP